MIQLYKEPPDSHTIGDGPSSHAVTSGARRGGAAYGAAHNLSAGGELLQRLEYVANGYLSNEIARARAPRHEPRPQAPSLASPQPPTPHVLSRRHVASRALPASVQLASLRRFHN